MRAEKKLELISNKDINYPFSVLVWILGFILLKLLVILADVPNSGNKVYTILILIIAGLLAFGDHTTIQIQETKKLLFLGQETGVWLEPGFYFLFWVFSLAEGERQKNERKDTIVEGVKCQDKNGKVLVADANGDWAIGSDEESRQNYLLQDEGKMPTNLQSLLKRTLARVIGSLIYKTHILGKDLAEVIMIDPIFLRECKKYGIVYTNMIAIAVSANMDQEAINSFLAESIAAQKAEYPAGHRFTKEELQKIEENAQVRVRIAKRIITNSALLGRYDVKD